MQGRQGTLTNDGSCPSWERALIRSIQATTMRTVAQQRVAVQCTLPEARLRAHRPGRMDVSVAHKFVAHPRCLLFAPIADVRSKTGRSNATGASTEDDKFGNYHDFIRVSKEIGSLENDMLELKELLKEWNRVPRTLELEEMQGGELVPV